MPKVSIIIRAKNEEKYLGQVLQKLKDQTFQDFEIILVNNNSTDNTVKIARKYGAKVVNVQKGKFTYPYAMNLGAKQAKGEYLVYLSGHSIPIKTTFLANGISNFKDKKVAGVFAYQLALPDANKLERIVYFIGSLFRRKKYELGKGQIHAGALGATNATVRKNLWELRGFDLRFAGGGEDGDWAKYWTDKGYKIVHEPGFAVYHSHNLGPVGLVRQLKFWRDMAKPNPYQGYPNNLK